VLLDTARETACGEELPQPIAAMSAAIAHASAGL